MLPSRGDKELNGLGGLQIQNCLSWLGVHVCWLLDWRGEVRASGGPGPWGSGPAALVTETRGPLAAGFPWCGQHGFGLGFWCCGGLLRIFPCDVGEGGAEAVNPYVFLNTQMTECPPQPGLSIRRPARPGRR